MFIGRTDTEAPIIWSTDGKSRLIGKDPDAVAEKKPLLTPCWNYFFDLHFVAL